MPPKVRQQLLGALQQRDAAPAAKDLPAGVPQPPTSATVWASAAWDEVCPDGGRQPAHGSKAAASVLNGLGAATAFAAFDLCVGDNSIYEGACIVAPTAWQPADVDTSNGAED
jgi:hypothetical protein